MNFFAPCKGIRIAESGKFSLIKALWYPESGNFFCGIRNPGLHNLGNLGLTYDWNP